MINKLLDEPYWDELDQRILDVVKKHVAPRDLLFLLMGEKIQFNGFFPAEIILKEETNTSLLEIRKNLLDKARKEFTRGWPFNPKSEYAQTYQEMESETNLNVLFNIISQVEYSNNPSEELITLWGKRND